MHTHALRLTVTAKRAVADNAVLVVLGAPDGARLPDWTPGAHIVLDLPAGPRCYSLCGDRWDAFTYAIAVRRDPRGRGGSAYVHDDLRPGDCVLVSPPANHFPMVPAADYLFIAGGIGITPLLPMIAQAVRLGVSWRLTYRGRSRASMPFTAELAALPGTIHLSPGDEAGPLDIAEACAPAAAGTAVYVCGPESLLRAVRDQMAALGRRVRSESFGPEQSERAIASPFAVVLRDGTRLAVPADRSLLDVLGEAGLPVRGSCLQGVCGSCETRFVRGVVDHRDLILDRQGQLARSTMFPCVSRARTPELVLDL